jgi:hypothetical protein
LNYKSLDISKERIDEIVAVTYTAVSNLNTIYKFSEWVNENFENLNMEEVNSIYEGFEKSNEHSIEKINKILNSSFSFSSSTYHSPSLSKS